MPEAQRHAILAIDAGQTAVRSRLHTGEHLVDADFAGLRTDTDLFPQIAAIVAQAIAAMSTDVVVSIGTTGLTRARSRADDLLKLLPRNVSTVFLAHDSITGFLGGVGTNPGTMTAVGTGVVTLAVGDTELARVDGWGNLIGDAGSAYWIGRAGLEAAMRAYDGRRPPTALLDLLRAHFTHPEEAYIDLQTDPERVSRIASFAKPILELANTDSAAAELARAAGEELALSAATAARRVGLLEHEHPRFTWTGNVMKSTVLREAFSAGILLQVPHATIEPPRGEPIDGVALLAETPKGSPLWQVIRVATR